MYARASRAQSPRHLVAHDRVHVICSTTRPNESAGGQSSGAHAAKDRSSSAWTAPRSPPRRGRRRRDRPGRRTRPGLRTPSSAGDGGASESDPEAVVVGAGGGAAPVRIRTPAPAAAVSQSAGQQHGLVTLDRAGRPVRPALLWNDVRSAPQRDRLVEELGGPKAWAERIGSVPAPSFTATKWAWLQRERAGGGPRRRGRPAPPRLPHRTAHGLRHHRPRRRLGHRLVAPGTERVRRGDPRPDRAGPRPAAARGRGTGEAAGTGTADSRTCGLPTGRRGGHRHRRQHGRRARASGCGAGL